MTAMIWIVAWGVTALLSAVVAGFVAAAKRRDHSFWSAWAFLFPPMLIVLLLLPANDRRTVRTRLDDEDRIDAH